jgi:hypothetical protein
MSIVCRPGSHTRLRWLAVAIIIATSACGGGGPEDTNEYNPPPYVYQDSNWERFDVIDLAGQAALNPNVQAQTDAEGKLHIFYYKRGDVYKGNQTRYQIHHVVWDPLTTAIEGEDEIVPVQSPNPGDAQDSGLNNCLVLDAAVTPAGTPVIAYQGGDIPQAEDGTSCNLTAQGDLMINRLNGPVWEEYLGIMGDASPKNPYFTDGYVGVAGSIAIDRNNNIHMAAQHYYEFCDWTSTNYPDLLYVRQTPNQLGHYSTSMEEHVDDYDTFGSGGGVQSDMGYLCKLVLDPDDNPAIFYVGTPIQDGIGEDRRSLRMAVKSGNQWVPEIIEVLDQWDVGWLSGAIDSTGMPAVAYYMRDIDQAGDYPDHLRYAHRDADGKWQVSVVDNSAQCGDFCSLTFDSQNHPAIAYYDISARSATYRKHQDLKYAYFNGSNWQIEAVATAGDIGQYNTLWFDGAGVPYICTYELNEQKIVILRKRSE